MAGGDWAPARREVDEPSRRAIAVEGASGLSRERFLRDYETTGTPCLVVPTECEALLAVGNDEEFPFAMDRDESMAGSTAVSVAGFVEREGEWRRSSSATATTAARYFVQDEVETIWCNAEIEFEGPPFCGSGLGDRTVRLGSRGASESISQSPTACGWVYVCEGSTDWTLEGRRFSQKAGQLVFVPPAATGSFSCREPTCAVAESCAFEAPSSLWKDRPDLVAAILEWLPTREIVRAGDFCPDLDAAVAALDDSFWRRRLALDFDDDSSRPPLSTTAVCCSPRAAEPRALFRRRSPWREAYRARADSRLCPAVSVDLHQDLSTSLDRLDRAVSPFDDLQVLPPCRDVCYARPGCLGKHLASDLL